MGDGVVTLSYIWGWVKHQEIWLKTVSFFKPIKLLSFIPTLNDDFGNKLINVKLVIEFNRLACL